MNNRTLIVTILNVLLIGGWIGVAFLWKRLVDLIPRDRRLPLLGIWAITYAIVVIAMYWREIFLTGTFPTYQSMLQKNLPLFSCIVAGWLLSVIAQRRRERRQRQNPEGEN